MGRRTYFVREGNELVELRRDWWVTYRVALEALLWASCGAFIGGLVFGAVGDLYTQLATASEPESSVVPLTATTGALVGGVARWAYLMGRGRIVGSREVGREPYPFQPSSEPM